MQAEFKVVSSAPLLFVAAVLLVGIVIWWVLSWHYKGRIDTQKTTIKYLETQTNQIQRTESDFKKIAENSEEQGKMIEQILDYSKDMPNQVQSMLHELKTVSTDTGTVAAEGLETSRELSNSYSTFLQYLLASSLDKATVDESGWHDMGLRSTKKEGKVEKNNK